MRIPTALAEYAKVVDAANEAIGYVICSTPVDGTPFEGRYAVLLLSYFSDAYAVFYED